MPEYLATGELKLRYEDMKAVLQVPWMGVVTMAFAHYRPFYDVLWNGLRPLCLSTPFVKACRELRASVEERVRELAPRPLGGALAAAGYAPREIGAIGEAVEIFSHGNFPYLLLATMARRLLEGEELSGSGSAPPYAGRHAPEISVPLVLMEAHHADAPTQAIYADVKTTLGLPFVNTDYRALARWPSYFARAWADLKPKIATPLYTALVADAHRRAVDVATSLPNPGGLRSAMLQEAAARDGSLDDVLAVVRLFQWLLPGLVVNVAFFREQLLSSGRSVGAA